MASQMQQLADDRTVFRRLLQVAGAEVERAKTWLSADDVSG
jgi:outer membrane murein-binding lipoprotein Lpp